MSTRVPGAPLWCAAIALIALMAPPVWAGQVPCAAVLKQLHRTEGRGDYRGADARRVARSLDTSVAWVEECAAVYGRRLRPGRAPRVNREEVDSFWEENEPEERAIEELETQGEVAFDPAPYRDRARQRGFMRNDREWAPYEHPEWAPNTGYKWSPYIDDPMRTLDDDLGVKLPK